MSQKVPKKSRYTQTLAMAVATGQTIKAAAQMAGCSEDMAYRISRSNEFKQAVSEVRAEALHAAVGVLSAAATRAAGVMVELMEDQDPKIRLAACSKLMDRIVPMTELHELRQEIQELREQMIQANPTLRLAN
jgi:hypothetical protein